MKRIWKRVQFLKKKLDTEVGERLEKVGISKKESIAILFAIYNPLYWFVPFIPTAIVAVYVSVRIFYIQVKKRKSKPQEL